MAAEPLCTGGRDHGENRHGECSHGEQGSGRGDCIREEEGNQVACVKSRLEQVGEHKVLRSSGGQHAGDNEQLTRMPGDGRRVLVEHCYKHRDEGHCDAGEDDRAKRVADRLVVR